MIRKANIWTLCLLSALILLTACTDYDALLPTKAEEPSQSERLSNADSLFLNLSIVSNAHTTRATEAEESAIYDGILCIFEGSDAATATLKTATVIDQLIYNPNEHYSVAGGSANSIQITQRLVNGTHAYGTKLFALTLLNTTATGFGVDKNTGKLQFKAANANSYSNLPDNTTYSDIQNHTLNSVGSPERHVGLFMTNATATGLVEITPATHLFDTEEAAAADFANHCITIPVERAAARIKVTNDIPASKALSNIHLNAVSTAHPLIHKITWALASELPGNTEATGANSFSLFHQHSHESGEAVYVPETSSATEIIVEVQLKDASGVLLGDCYSFPILDSYSLYTDLDALIEFYKSGWSWQRYTEDYAAISSWSAEDVFRNTKVTMLDDGEIKVSLLTDESLLTGETAVNQRTALKKLEDTLSDLTQGYRDGKMYYTYSVPSLVRNNAYNLSLVELGDIDTHYVAVTFNYQDGQGWAASFSNNSANLFTTSRVVTGSNMNYNGWDTNFGQAKYNPTAEHSSPTADDNIDFLLDPEEGWTFTPSRVAFNTTRYGTDGGKIDVYWLNSGLASDVSLDTGIVPYRNNQTVNVLSWNKSSFTAGSVGDGECGLRLVLYKLKNDKQVGFSDVVISGTLTKTSTDSTQKSLSGVGSANP